MSRTLALSTYNDNVDSNKKKQIASNTKYIFVFRIQQSSVRGSDTERLMLSNSSTSSQNNSPSSQRDSPSSQRDSPSSQRDGPSSQRDGPSPRSNNSSPQRDDPLSQNIGNTHHNDDSLPYSNGTFQQPIDTPLGVVEAMSPTRDTAHSPPPTVA